MSMHNHEYSFFYDQYDSSEELDHQDAELLNKARSVTQNAYAPYSRFAVGAAARLANGQVVTGTNQENVSFPAGICAERTLLSVASSLYPGVPIETLAISYDHENNPSDHPIFPCGICRQSLKEFELRTARTMRLILGGLDGMVYIIPQAGMLLPFAFTAARL